VHNLSSLNHDDIPLVCQTMAQAVMNGRYTQPHCIDFV